MNFPTRYQKFMEYLVGFVFMGFRWYNITVNCRHFYQNCALYSFRVMLGSYIAYFL